MSPYLVVSALRKYEASIFTSQLYVNAEIKRFFKIADVTAKPLPLPQVILLLVTYGANVISDTMLL